MGRPDLAFAFTKIALWRQTQFRKVVYLDADVVALRALDELFGLEAPFAAAPDVGWPDAFNTGVMVISPNMGDYWALQTMAAAADSFDGADQGLLNQYYEHRSWHRLGFTYNCTPNAQYQWEPAYRYYKRDIGAVHFIGKDKPWSSGRTGGGGPGVYNELLARWWAVYDRHLKAATTPQSGEGPSGRRYSTTVQQYVHGQATSADFGTSSLQHIAAVPDIVEPEAPIITTEAPLSEPGEAVENIDQGVVEPTPTIEQRKFSAPQMQWDATRFEPPAASVPEAANFPTQTYEFNESKQLFQAPRSYPAPPTDMWYQVPETRPTPAERPRAIFPWEKEPDRPQATRVFAEDLASPPQPGSGPSLGDSAQQFTTTHYEEGAGSPPGQAQATGPGSPERPSSPQTADQQWQTFQQNNSNAWDAVPGIDTYVRAIMESQTKRGKPQLLHQDGVPEDILSPAISRKDRRQSLILTDFPSAMERPSLPVTPAPIRRPTFWGEERDEAGELPQAEGVPEQEDWVCPKCGFISVRAEDFRRDHRHSSDASTTTALASAPPASSQSPSTTKPRENPPSPIFSPATTLAGSPDMQYRAGISPRGAPLASLTDALLQPSSSSLEIQTHFPGFSAP